MVNDKMVKGFMEKKLYNVPRVEAIFMESLNIMKTSTELPIDPSSAPRRPTDLF